MTYAIWTCENTFTQFHSIRIDFFRDLNYKKCDIMNSHFIDSFDFQKLMGWIFYFVFLKLPRDLKFQFFETTPNKMDLNLSTKNVYTDFLNIKNNSCSARILFCIHLTVIPDYHKNCNEHHNNGGASVHRLLDEIRYRKPCPEVDDRKVISVKKVICRRAEKKIKKKITRHNST